MQRVLEPELMTEDKQARAYAEADFEEPHSRFIDLFRQTFPSENFAGYVADLGCGPGDIAVRFAQAYPKCVVHGVDGSRAMLRYGLERLQTLPELAGRIQLIEGYLPAATFPRLKYTVVISNSLLHHLPDPAVLWNSVRKLAEAGTLVFVMDLRRPSSLAEARELQETYTQNEPAVLQRDFYNSLLAAFEPAEIEQQLARAKLDSLTVQPIGDRHVLISGRIE
jgi:SAM-dependent methyltransferase